MAQNSFPAYSSVHRMLFLGPQNDDNAEVGSIFSSHHLPSEAAKCFSESFSSRFKVSSSNFRCSRGVVGLLPTDLPSRSRDLRVRGVIEKNDFAWKRNDRKSLLSIKSNKLQCNFSYVEKREVEICACEGSAAGRWRPLRPECSIHPELSVEHP